MDSPLKFLLFSLLLRAAMGKSEPDLYEYFEINEDTSPSREIPKAEMSFYNSKPVLTELEELNAESGTIEFSRGNNPNLRTKIWVLRSEKVHYLRDMSFVLEENGLGSVARLSLWGSGFPKQHMWTGSQGDWQTERRVDGYVILLTLRISLLGPGTPSFKVKFHTTHSSRYFFYSSKVLREEGLQLISYPPNNAEEYLPYSKFVAVVAPPSGSPFGLTLKYLNVPGTPPRFCFNSIQVLIIDDNPNELRVAQSPSFVRQCGTFRNISEPLGNYTIAIIHFDNFTGLMGRGFKIQVN